jgi:ABC-type glycerol-3-phosphate transport system permease component
VLAGRVRYEAFIKAVVFVPIAVVWLAPTIGLLITSFRPQSDILSSGSWTVLFSPRFTLENYTEVLTSQGLFAAFLNSLQIAIPATLFPLLIAALAGYALAWIRFPFRDTLFLLIITLMMIPVQIGFIPLVRVLGNAGLTRGFVAVWLAHAAFALPFGIFLLRNFFITLPGSLLRGGPDRRGQRVEDLPVDRDPAVGPGDRLAGHLPVPVGLERSAHGPWSSSRTRPPTR